MSTTKTIIPVLDHGYARLVSFMQPVPRDSYLLQEGFAGIEGKPYKVQPDNWTGDLEVVRNARVSFDADWRTGEEEGKDKKLINYMMKNHHTSPFEAMAFTFEIKVPLFIARQWHRHRTWSYSEVSARYADLPREFYVPLPEHVGTQSASNKQVRDISEAHEPTDMEKFFISQIRKDAEEGFAKYEEMLELGCPRELARSVLSLNTYTRYFGTVNLHNLFHFLRLRLHPHAQWEIQQYAKALLELITPIVPVSVEAFKLTLQEK
jgi:thymidylate synthase (FAD)